MLRSCMYSIERYKHTITTLFDYKYLLRLIDLCSSNPVLSAKSTSPLFVANYFLDSTTFTPPARSIGTSRLQTSSLQIRDGSRLQTLASLHSSQTSSLSA